ncbi:CdaR family transcriptional regulator [Sediminibacillus albus]|uniref:Carbohydrate diacid regulator n=1 Tax=Sediminibacillus albus TaxID=407036 RepID=A0A1G8YAY2_9BACI|nr:sugar diacid recognition domain-containing protein [Sediminibacillus albus]SDJ99886.1 carbohydrate diacid regulator [Sediminibacillus albus]
MYLTPKLGKKIVAEVKNLIDEHLIIVNPEGTIIASTDKSRIGDYHQGAEIACKEKKEIILSAEDESALQGVKAGINLPILLNDQPLGAIGITGNPAEVTRFGSLVKKMTELLIQENVYLQQMEWETRTLEAYVFDWLQQDQAPVSFLQNGTLLGINMNRRKSCTIIHIEAEEQQHFHDLFHYIRTWWNNKATALVARWGNDRCLLIQDVEEQANTTKLDAYLLNTFQTHILQRFGIATSIGAGPDVPAGELKVSFQKAEKALTIARKTQTIVFYEDLLLEMCLQEITPQTKREFVEKSIGSLLSEPDLLTTLKSYLSNNLNLVKTADELSVHINTVHYRLKRVKEITGIDSKELSSLVSYYLAFEFLDDNTI